MGNINKILFDYVCKNGLILKQEDLDNLHFDDTTLKALLNSEILIQVADDFYLYTEFEALREVKKQHLEKNEKTKLDINPEVEEKLIQYYKRKRKSLRKSKGMTLLKYFAQDETKYILSHEKELNSNDIQIYRILDIDESERLILRYINPEKKPADETERLLELKRAYYNGKEYEECIKVAIELLAESDANLLEEAKLLAELYIKTYDFKRATTYLTFAYYHEVKSQEKDKYKRLIEKFSKTKRNDEKQETKKDLNKLNNILKGILNNEIKVEDLNLTETEKILLNLKLAKEFYKIGWADKGDEFLKYVERIKNKPEEVKTALRELSETRKFLLMKAFQKTFDMPKTMKPIGSENYNGNK